MVFNLLNPDLSEDDDVSPQLSPPTSPSFTVCVPLRSIFTRAYTVASRVTEEASLAFTAVDVSRWRQEESSDALDLQSPRPQPPAQITVVLKVNMHCEACAMVCQKRIRKIRGVEMVETDLANNRIIVKGMIDGLKLVEYVKKRTGKQVLILADEEEKPPAQITVVLKVNMHCEACAMVCQKRIRRIRGVEMVETDLANDRIIVKGVINGLKLVEYVKKRTGKQALILEDEEEKLSPSSNVMGFLSVGTSTVTGADDRSQLDGVTNAITQISSLQTPYIPLQLPASEQGQATGARSSPANQNDNVDKPANVDAQKSLSVPTPSVSPVLPSPGHSPLPSSMLQPVSQTDGEEILGSFVKARLTLERSVKILLSEAVSFDIATPESSSILVITNDVVKHKWAEFLELSKGGYPLIAANPATTERVKALLKELCGGDIRFSKSPKFRKSCEDFLAQFLGGIDTYRQNCERIAALAALEKDYQHSDDFIEGLDQTLKDSRHTLLVLVNEQNDLAAEETKLEIQLAELETQLMDVRRRRRLKAAEIIQADRTLESHLGTFDVLISEKYRLNKEWAEHRHAKNQLVVDNSCLELDMSIFQKEVRDFLDSM